MTQTKVMKKDSVSVGDTVYVTKYYLSQGIIEGKVVSKPSTENWDAIYWSPNASIKYQATHKDFFLTYAEAAERGLELIANKKKVIAKQLEKLDEMEQKLTDYLES